MRQSPVMHHHRVSVPEIDGWKVAGQDLLRLGIVCAALVHAPARGRVGQQRVQPRVRVVDAIGSLG